MSIIGDLKQDYPLLYEAAKTEHEQQASSPSGAEAEEVLYELWLARTNIARIANADESDGAHIALSRVKRLAIRTLNATRPENHD